MMYVRERLLSIRLTERLRKQPELAERLAIELPAKQKETAEKKFFGEKK